MIANPILLQKKYSRVIAVSYTHLNHNKMTFAMTYAFSENYIRCCPTMRWCI